MIQSRVHVAVAEPGPALLGDVGPKALRALQDELRWFVLKRVHDSAAAEDIVQEVFARAYAGQATLREPSKLRSWMYQITRNAIVDHYRTQRPSEVIPDVLVAEVDGQRAQLELAGCMVPLLDDIPDLYRQALMLAEFEGRTQRETASILGLSVSGAKSRVQRGRRMLRGALLRCCRVELDRLGGVLEYEFREGGPGCGGSAQGAGEGGCPGGRAGGGARRSIEMSESAGA